MIENVLLIDDNAVDNFVNLMVIQNAKYGEKIKDFLYANEALDYLKGIELDDKQIPDIIFLDINMPVMNGFMFLEEFDNLSDSITKKVKIVMLSSSMNPEDVKRSMANSHVIKFLDKPLTAEKLKVC